MKVVTVTLNPAIDKTIEISGFKIGKLNKVESVRSDIGGKGINVSKVLYALGTDSTAVGFVAGATGKSICQGLDAMGIRHDMVEVSGDTRTNLKIFDRSLKEITEVNEPGPQVSEQDLMDLAYKIDRMASREHLFVFSGSMPKGLDTDAYVGLIGIAKEKGARVFLDADGMAFKSGVEAIPHMIKPNREELERYFNQSIETDAEILKAMDHFIEKGIQHVFVTMGSSGAYYGSRESYYKIEPLKVEAHSSVGAGDAFVGGVCHAFASQIESGQPDVEQMLRWAVATSAGAVETIGTNPASLDWVETHMPVVSVEKIGGVY